MSAAAVSTSLRPSQPELHEAVGWIDARVRDSLGRRVGRVCAVWADRDGRPWWIAVRRRGRTLVAPVNAVQAASTHEILLSCTAASLVPAEGAIDGAMHEDPICRFGLDRRRIPRRPSPGCEPPRLPARRSRG